MTQFCDTYPLCGCVDICANSYNRPYPSSIEERKRAVEAEQLMLEREDRYQKKVRRNSNYTPPKRRRKKGGRP